MAGRLRQALREFSKIGRMELTMRETELGRPVNEVDVSCGDPEPGMEARDPVLTVAG